MHFINSWISYILNQAGLSERQTALTNGVLHWGGTIAAVATVFLPEVVLLDVSGVPLIDTHVAGLLVRLTQMLRLLGARIVQSPAAVVAHVGGGSSAQKSAFAEFHGARSTCKASIFAAQMKSFSDRPPMA